MWYICFRRNSVRNQMHEAVTIENTTKTAISSWSWSKRYETGSRDRLLMTSTATSSTKRWEYFTVSARRTWRTESWSDWIRFSESGLTRSKCRRTMKKWF
jgi:hypothetical protein